MARRFTEILTAIPARDAGDGLSSALLEAALRLDRRAIVKAAQALRRRGLITARAGAYRRTEAGDAVVAAGAEIKPGPMRPGRDAAADKARLRPPRKDKLANDDTLLQRVWAALRVLKKATIPELLELALRADDRPGRDADSGIRKYLGHLMRAGIVIALDRRAAGIAQTSNGFVRYSLIRDLGPRAPLWQRTARRLIDRNSGAALDAVATIRPVSRRKVRA